EDRLRPLALVFVSTHKAAGGEGGATLSLYGAGTQAPVIRAAVLFDRRQRFQALLRRGDALKLATCPTILPANISSAPGSSSRRCARKFPPAPRPSFWRSPVRGSRRRQKRVAHQGLCRAQGRDKLDRGVCVRSASVGSPLVRFGGRVPPSGVWRVGEPPLRRDSGPHGPASIAPSQWPVGELGPIPLHDEVALLLLPGR